MNANISISNLLYIFSFLNCEMFKNYLLTIIFLKDNYSKTWPLKTWHNTFFNKCPKYIWYINDNTFYQRKYNNIIVYN